jgi:N-sulfoglucosamine sulfohydrolase
MKRRLVLAAIVCTIVLSVSDVGAADEPRKPNILFMIMDDWGWNHAGAYGCEWVATPTFDRIAREGVLFHHCFTSNPKCSPCRASILTGRNTWQLEEASCHNGLFPAKFPVYPDLLEQAGYHVGLTGKGWGPGDYKGGGFTRNPAGPEYQSLTFSPPQRAMGNTDLPNNFKQFLDERQPGQPFCFWMGAREPHRAYEFDAGIRAGKDPASVTVPGYLPDHDVVRRDMLDYSTEVEWADKLFGQTLEILEQAGELDNTLIVMTSDHGMPFPRVKGQIYEDGFRLPLAMRWGSVIKPGRVVDDFVNVRDLAPTFLEIGGVEVPGMMTGHSLVNILRSEKSGWVEDRKVMLMGKERHDIGRPYDWGYPARGIRTPEYFLVHNFHPERWPAGNPEADFGNCDPSPTKEFLKQIGGYFYELAFGKRPECELYRLSDDPECIRNLASDPAFDDIKAELKRQMFALLRKDEDPRALGNGHVFDDYRYLSGREKGYETWLKRQTFEMPSSPHPRSRGTRQAETN